MQEEVTQKTIALVFKSSRLTADVLRWSSIFVTFTLKKRDCFKFCVKSKN